MIVDGKAIAAEILASVKEKLNGRAFTVRAIAMAPTPTTESYLKIKERAAVAAGMTLQVVRVENDATTEDLIEKVELPGADAVIVQLPLPEHIDTEKVLSAIPLTKDADLLSRDAEERFAEDGIAAPVADAVREILERNNVETADRKAVVLGQGRLVGVPVVHLLLRMGAQVTALTEETWNPDALKDADIIVTGTGKAHLVQPKMIKEGVVLIDAGTSELGEKLAGDTDPTCAEKASVFTPVPGGVGPVAVACLFRNALLLSDLS